MMPKSRNHVQRLCGAYVVATAAKDRHRQAVLRRKNRGNFREKPAPRTFHEGVQIFQLPNGRPESFCYPVQAKDQRLQVLDFEVLSSHQEAAVAVQAFVHKP
mmetsp:Transcript_8728/g.16019  ORF Transcript_8728/g.16019 Transcript_8728/m.16019 type:complete len:102 (+) Transcript_8728:694-999(+)